MNQNSSLIVTSIAAPNAVMQSLAEGALKHKVNFIVIGDEKSPSEFSLNGCRFYSLDEQRNLDSRLAKILPIRHYGRKNLGYLLARNSDMIIETDDDNFPYPEFWFMRMVKHQTETIVNGGWVNVYNRFSDDDVWPRGFPLEEIGRNERAAGKMTDIIAPIQQGLADQNPDVDAVYRMTRKLPIEFLKRNHLALGEGSWCPFNSQNTTWFREAYPLLYLPSYCSFRMTDIWRSFIAQRIAWTCGWSLLFHQSTVWQERNDHSLLKDFEDEVPGYLNNFRICKLLEGLSLKNGVKHIPENLLSCYESMVQHRFIGKDEMKLLEAWIFDMEFFKV